MRVARRAPILFAVSAGWLLMVLLGALGPSALRAQAQCTVASFGAATSFPVGGFPNTIVAADLNGDGRLDLATANLDSSTVAVLLGNGDGTFGAATSFPVGRGPTTIVAADLNGDGRLDLATANQISTTVAVLLGNEDGTFGAATTIPMPPSTAPASLAVADLNGDGRLDLATTNPSRDSVSVLLNTC
jgi:hypothetical protein